MDDTSADPPVAEPDEEGEGPGALDRRRFLAVAGGAAIVALGGAVLWRTSQDGSATDAAGTATTTPDPPLSVTPSTEAPLPVPERPPDNPYAPTPQVVLGSLTIPRIAVTAPLQQGITLTAINRGPGHWPGTPMPGELGNVVVAGHRTTFSKPFRHLDELQPGDPVVFQTEAGSFTYQVRGVIIVDGEAIDIAAQSHAHTATLFACHPPGSAAQRIVAKLRLLGPDGQPVEPDAALPPLEAGTQPGDHTLLMKSSDPLATSSG